MATEERSTPRGEDGGEVWTPRRPVVRLPPDEEIVGRDAELEKIWRAVNTKAVAKRASITVIAGGPGVGKSSLAVHVAHSERVRRMFPDGQLYFDLQVTVRPDRGLGEPADPQLPAEEDPVDASARQLLRDFLTGVGLSPDEVAESHRELVGQFTKYTAGRRFFVVVDNVMDERQVRDLIPANRDCHVVVIARRRLGAHHIVPGMPGANELPLDLQGLESESGVELFRRHAGEDGELSEEDRASLEWLVERCDGNPLAIRVLGATRSVAPHEPLDRFVDSFRRSELWSNRIPESNNLWASFKMCYETLSAAGRDLFQSLGAVPGKTFDRQLAAALIDGPDETAAQQLLVSLWDAQLLQPDRDGYFTMHALLREFALKGLESAGGRRRAPTRRRISDFYLRRTRQACAAIHAPVHSQVRQRELRWLSDERQNLVAAILSACQETEDEVAELDFAWQLCEVLADFFELRGVWEAWDQTCQATLERLEKVHAAHSGLGRAHLLRGLGRLDGALRRWSAAVDKYRRAMVLFRQSREHVEVGTTLRALGDVYRYTRNWDAARNCLEKSHEILANSDRRADFAITKRSLGAIRRADGAFDKAEQLYLDAIAILREVGDVRWEAATSLSLSDIYLDQHQTDEAEQRLKDCLAVFAEFEDFHWYGLTLRSLGEAQRLKREYEAALESLARSDETLSQIGDSLWRASVLHAKGMVHLQQSQFADALDCFEKCLPPFRANGDILWEGRTFLSIGLTLTQMHGGRLTHAAAEALHNAWPLLIEQNSQEDLAQLDALLALGEPDA